MTLMVVSNFGTQTQNHTVYISTPGFPGGLKVVDVLNCRVEVVASNGSLQAHVPGGLPAVSAIVHLRSLLLAVLTKNKVYYPYFLLPEHELCSELFSAAPSVCSKLALLWLAGFWLLFGLLF